MITNVKGATMADNVESHTLEYLRRLDRKVDAVINDQRAMQIDLRRNTEAVAGLSRSIEHMRDDLVVMLKAEIGGMFANLETRLEHRIADQIDARTNPQPD